MKNKPSLTRRILYNNNLLKILSLVIAVLFWFIVVINVNTDYTRTINNVEVKIDENSSSLTSIGLHVVDMSQKSISVQVSGARNIIGALDSSDFVVTPNISKVTKSGTYEIELTAAPKSPDNRVKILKVNPSSISVSFDTLATKTLPVEVKINGGNVPDGYLMQTYVAAPASITVSGPTSELTKIDKAQVTVPVANGSTKTVSDKYDVKILDKSGEEINSEHILLSNSDVQVTVPILKMKEVPLKLNFMNVPSDVDSSIISYTVSPSTITVAGDEETIDELKEVSLGTLDFNDFDIDTDKEIEVKTPDGIVNIENVTTAKVNVKLNDTASKVVETTDFTVTDAPQGYTVTNLTKKLTNIKVYGPKNEIASLTTVRAYIDMSSVQSGTGQHEVPVKFKVPGKTGYWVRDSYNVVVSVRK